MCEQLSIIITIFYIEATCLTSMPGYLKGITQTKFRLNFPLLHIWNKVLERQHLSVSSCKIRPLMGPLQILLWEKFIRFFRPTFLNFTCSIFYLFMSSEETFSCTNSKCSSSLSFIQFPTIPKMYAKPHLSISCKRQIWLTSHPNKLSLNFLLNNGELMKFPLTTNLKMVCASMPHSSLHNTIWQYIHPQ